MALVMRLLLSINLLQHSFQNITSSSRFAQANGEAELGVQIAKNLLRKAADPYFALLAYRVMPLKQGTSQPSCS